MSLTEQFLLELFKLAFLKRSILDVLKQHVKYQYLPDKPDSYKKILKAILSIYDSSGEIPTYGGVSQFYPNDIDVQECLLNIKNASISNIDSILLDLEEYIKFSRFQLMFYQAKDTYNSDKQYEAIEYVKKESEEIANFSITKNTSYFSKVFQDFKDEQKRKHEAKERGDFDRDKVPFGISLLDIITYGGIDKGDTACLLARSGVGKSTFLKWVGMYACRLGYDVLHIQLEGSRDECYDKYTQVWTAQPYVSVKYGELDLDDDKKKQIEQVIQQMEMKHRDIFIYAFEMFDEGSCADVRNLILKYYKERGRYPHLVLVDSLDLLHPGDGLKYGISTEAMKAKKENSARKLKNIATEFQTRILTADQADGIEKQFWNDPSWVMTSQNTSLAKGTVQSFSFYLTLNQTESEKKNGLARIYCDKLRNYFVDNKVLRIATAFEFGRFFDAKKTKELSQEIEDQPTKKKTNIKATNIRDKVSEEKKKDE